jgi:hypothetical protein
VALYLAVYLGAAAAGQAGIVRMGWRYARIARRRWLRHGLRVTVAGAVCGLLFCACKAWFVTGVLLGVEFRPAETSAPLFGSLAALLEVGGLTLPAWGPRLAGLRAAVLRYAAYRQLTPLWRELYRATPQIALVPPRRYGDWLITDVSFRLYRRVIEIRDGRLALRPHFDPDVAAAARQLGRAAGLTGRSLDATVEAAVLAAAIRAKGRDQRTADALPITAALLDGPGGSDLSEEIRWLVPVSRALARSRVVRGVLTDSRVDPRIVPRPVAAR